MEVYDLSPDADSFLANISTRSFVQTTDNVMIGGFIVQGTQPKMVIIRAIGPELTPFGVPNVLANPTLELHNGAGALIASNDNWQTTIIGGIIMHDQVQEILNSGRAPTDPRESAIIANLPAGNYTAIVRGINNSTGVALGGSVRSGLTLLPSKPNTWRLLVGPTLPANRSVLGLSGTIIGSHLLSVYRILVSVGIHPLLLLQLILPTNVLRVESNKFVTFTLSSSPHS